MLSTRDIKTRACQLGIDDIKTTTATLLTPHIQRFQEQKKAGLFTKRAHRHFTDLARFYDVRRFLGNARSVITACLCYLTDEQEDKSQPGTPYGRIARYTWRNYYKELRIRLKKLAQYIRSEKPSSHVVYSNGPVAEKPLAQRAGLGFYGRHSIILHPRYGSWIVLGEIITDIALDPDQPLTMDCGDCRQCIDICPTGAIKKPYIIDRTRCIQELTNWCDHIPEDIMDVWGNRLYGCTACQDICPANQSVAPKKPQTTIGQVGPCVPLFDILDINESEYRTRYADNQITASWIHFRAIQRNALIALGHTGDRTALSHLDPFCRSSDPLLSRAAQWAHTRIRNA